MRYFILISILFLFSCSSKKQTTPKSSSKIVCARILNPKGTVKMLIVTTEFKKDGCPILLKSIGDKDIQYFFPINLKEEHKVNGFRITVDYKVTKVPVKGTCKKGIPIYIHKSIKQQ